MKKRKVYVSVDIEASGPTPGKYSMLSLGACVVGDVKKQFYIELKPISTNYVLEGLKVACLGLELLKNTGNEVFNPSSDKFDPEATMAFLMDHGTAVEVAMKELAEWLALVCGPDEQAVLCSDTPIFDGMFTYYYLDNYNNGNNPFGYGGISFTSMYRGLVQDMSASLQDITVTPPKEGVLHNALYDCILHAPRMAEVLARMSNT